MPFRESKASVINDSVGMPNLNSYPNTCSFLPPLDTRNLPLPSLASPADLQLPPQLRCHNGRFDHALSSIWKLSWLRTLTTAEAATMQMGGRAEGPLGARRAGSAGGSTALGTHSPGQPGAPSRPRRELWNHLLWLAGADCLFVHLNNVSGEHGVFGRKESV